MKKIILIIIFLVTFFIFDLYLTYNNFIENNNYFSKNPFEITKYKHPEKVWDKVFFGSSSVTAAYDEDISNSGYINLGIDWGVVSDLYEMIDKKFITIGSELVIGLEYLMFYDDLDTIPTYIWHKRFYEPYVYFQRDRLYTLITTAFENLLKGEDQLINKYRDEDQQKLLYYGILSEEECELKIEKYEKLYYNQPINKFQKNMRYLEKILEYCKQNNISVKIIWMPWNNKYYKPKIYTDVRKEAEKIISKYNVDVLDLEDSFSSEHFHDLQHFNNEIGTPAFTAVFDSWIEELEK